MISLKRLIILSSAVLTPTANLTRVADTSWDWVGPFWNNDLNCRNCNYVRKNLAGVELTHSHLSRSDFTEAELSLSKLAWANMAKCSFIEASLSSAKAEHTKFRNSNFTFANLYDLQAIEADFSHSTMLKVNLTMANLTRSILRDVVLSYSNLSNAIFRMTDFTGAQLDHTLFYRSDLQNAILDQTNLAHAIFFKSNLQGASLRNSNLFYTQLAECNLMDADLRQANFTGANLTKAQLQYADLQNANFTSANLMNANLMGANICGAKLDHAIFCMTTMPNGVIINDHCVILMELDSALQKVQSENPSYTTAQGCQAFIASLIPPGSTKDDVTSFLKALQTSNPDQYAAFVGCSRILKATAARDSAKAVKLKTAKDQRALKQRDARAAQTETELAEVENLPDDTTPNTDHPAATTTNLAQHPPAVSATTSPSPANTPPASASCVALNQSCSEVGETCCAGMQCYGGTCCGLNGNSCNYQNDCCQQTGAQNCVGGKCCVASGGVCNVTALPGQPIIQCCSGEICENGHCCASLGSACTMNANCCGTSNCVNGQCCAAQGGACNTPYDCCTPQPGQPTLTCSNNTCVVAAR